MTAPIERAMILAAGFGTRLRPLTLTRPKPLLEVGGRPLISYVMANLAKAGIKEAIINTHYLGDQIRDALSRNSYGLRVHFLHESEILGTGGGLKNAQEFFEGVENFLLLNADTLIDIDLQAFMATHLRHRPLATLALTAHKNAKEYGEVGIDQTGQIHRIGKIVDDNGPVERELVFCGVHALSAAIFDWLPEEGCIIRQGYKNAMEAGQKLMAYEHLGYFSDVGTPERLRQANQDLLDGKFKI